MSKKREMDICKKLEAEFDNAQIILKLNQKEKIIGDIKLENRFIRKKGRPDYILWLSYDLKILGNKLQWKMPVLIEDETGGESAAKEDYETFFKEEKIEIPMLVIGGNRKKEKDKKCIIKLKIKQVPFYLAQ